MLKEKKAVIFDMDGSLIDSMWIWPEVDKEYVQKYHLTLPEDFHKAIEGKSYTETAAYFVDMFPSLHKTVEEVQAEWTNMTMELYKTRVCLKPGAREFLNKMKEQNVLLGIATSNGRTLAETALKALKIESYFASVRTACEVASGKPSPDVYLKVAEDLQMKPENCLVFEDIPNGIRAGKNAGMEVCAVDDAFSRPLTEEKKRLADYFIHDYFEIFDDTYERCGV
ncbi:HAD family phosphatase [Mediterraneibacter sp. NSJ-55]|uniref:HAD family phosphatase n=1 Tax=Mediterraneibacter hominis TaxID=2763054 RepID=A0A923LGV3_9FIRM|nr:HAD family phosphatase [Mediterraneibacter hominis]MBC5687846.1 HAD family phosphatase [Mediterraneibacter hominis]